MTTSTFAIRNGGVPERWPGHGTDLTDFPLIAPENTRLNLAAAPAAGKNVYFGTGVVTSKTISRGLPFDFLGMLLSAAWVRQNTGGAKIIHEISDAHALASATHDHQEIKAIANKQKEYFVRLAAALGLNEVYSCILASEYRQKSDFAVIQERVDRLSASDTPAYMRYQSAGNLYFRLHQDVGYKVGWLVEDDNNVTGLDERTFNHAYAKLDLPSICFVYTWCGWNFDARRARVSPYTFVNGEKRLMMESTQPAKEELHAFIEDCSNPRISRRALAHTARILTAYEWMFGSTKASFWADANTPGTIELPQPENWAATQYIDLDKLATRIDEIRFMQDTAFDTELLQALSAYRAEVTEN